MKIAISCLFEGLDRLGGLSIRLKALIVGLCESGHEIKVIQTTFAYNNSLSFYEQLKNYDIENIVIPYALNGKIGPKDIFKLYNLQIFDILKEYEIDVLDTYDPYLKIPKKHVHLIYSTNYCLPYLFNQIIYGGLRQSVFHIIKSISELNILLKSNSIIVENLNQKQWLIKWMKIPPNKSVVIPPGYNESVIYEISNRKDYLYMGNLLIILFAGRIVYLKGIFELLHAFKRITMCHKSCELWYVGDGPDTSKLEKLSEDLGLSNKVKFYGSVSHIETLKIINKSDIFVLPSYNEGVPLSIIEAMALKKPIIASDVGGISAHLVEHNVNGILIKPKNISSLESALKQMCSCFEMREKYGLSSWRKSQKLTNTLMINRTIDVYLRRK